MILNKLGNKLLGNKFLSNIYIMPIKSIYLKEKLIGHVNMASCNCQKFKYLGEDICGQLLLYDPQIHSIPECKSVESGGNPTPAPTPYTDTYDCMSSYRCQVSEGRGAFKTWDECMDVCKQPTKSGV